MHLDEMIQSEVDERLNPEGDSIADYAELLPDDYAMNSDRWNKAIEAAINPTHYVTGKGTQYINEYQELSADDLETIVDGIIGGYGLYEIEVRCVMSYSRDKDLAAWAIGELELQLPEGLESYESEEFTIRKMGDLHYAYANTDDVVTFALNRDAILEFLDDSNE